VDFVNFEQAKSRLGKSDDQLQEMIKKGELRAFRDGGTWKFRKEDIDAKAGAEAPAADKEAGDTLMSIDADILFAEEEEVPADSAAETWIAADTEGVFARGGEGEARGVEAALTAPEAEPAPLALSPETDESSLGAVLSEEELAGGEAPGGAEEPVIAVDAESGLAAVVPGSGAAAVGPSRTRIVTLVEPPAHHGEYTLMLGLTVVGLALAVLGAMAAITGAVPQFVVALGSESAPVMMVAVAVVIVGVAAGVGYVLGKQREKREALSA
jgi:excisionase family DNA binding protein